MVLIDGTLASLEAGHRSSIGRIHSALSGEWGALPRPVRMRYLPGLQWERMRSLPALLIGQELETSIRTAYLWLARRWQAGTPIYLFGYSRGAFAIRSLAGMIGQIGLLRRDGASRTRMEQAWQLYRHGAPDQAIADFRRQHCHDHTPIRMVGVFDTVMALGVRLPLLWMLTEPRYRYHDQHLGPHVELGVQALALDETRAVFQPILWADDEMAQEAERENSRVRQEWFRGAHPDIGGQLTGYEHARPLANIPLVWMLDQAQEAGLPLPAGWRAHLPCNPAARPIGSWRRWGKAFLARAPRVAGSNHSERLHPSVPLPYRGPAVLAGDLAQFAPPRPRPQRKRRRRASRPAPAQQGPKTT